MVTASIILTQGMLAWTQQSWQTLKNTFLLVTFKLVLCLFESVPTDYDDSGMLTACAGDQISIRCSHDNLATGATRWIFEPPIDCAEAIDHNPPISTHPCGPFTFHGVTELPQVPLHSTAEATASASMSGAVIECRDSGGLRFNTIGNLTLCIIGKFHELCGMQEV